MKDLNGEPVEVDVKVAVSRQVGYSVGQYLAHVVETYQDKQGNDKVKVRYLNADAYRIPKTVQAVGLDKVVVVVDRPQPVA